MSDMPSPRSAAALWVVDGNHPMWDALTWADQLAGSATVKVYSVEGMVATCVRNVIQNDRPLDYLAIFGHGMPGYQGVGSGKPVEYTGTNSIFYRSVGARGASPLYGNAAEKLAGLNGVLSSDATVLFCGCSTGKGNGGSNLLKIVSEILGSRAVQAYENDVYWWTGRLIGSLKEARGDGISTSWSYKRISPI
jgi:hypothetical protein